MPFSCAASIDRDVIGGASGFQNRPDLARRAAASAGMAGWAAAQIHRDWACRDAGARIASIARREMAYTAYESAERAHLHKRAFVCTRASRDMRACDSSCTRRQPNALQLRYACLRQHPHMKAVLSKRDSSTLFYSRVRNRRERDAEVYLPLLILLRHQSSQM